MSGSILQQEINENCLVLVARMKISEAANTIKNDTKLRQEWAEMSAEDAIDDMSQELMLKTRNYDCTGYKNEIRIAALNIYSTINAGV